MNVIVIWVAGAMFFIAGACALIRIIRGPSILDRMIASDMLLTLLMCVVGAEMVYHGHTATLPVLLVLALVAFIASVAVARYASKRSRHD